MDLQPTVQPQAPQTSQQQQQHNRLSKEVQQHRQ
jgi:hypothetical protein